MPSMDDTTTQSTHGAELLAPDVGDVLRAVWQRQRVRVSERVDLIERAVQALGQKRLDPGLREEAERAAHMLAGSLGTFGFASASRAAHDLEVELADPLPARAPALAALLAQARGDLGRQLRSSSRAKVGQAAAARRACASSSPSSGRSSRIG